jgi:hypothetical protein
MDALPSELLKNDAALDAGLGIRTQGRTLLRHDNRQGIPAPVRQARQDVGGAGRDRTDDPLLAKQVLSQLSYSPSAGPGGSGWIRTIDPRLIKTVL